MIQSMLEREGEDTAAGCSRRLAASRYRLQKTAAGATFGPSWMTDSH
jgi:hypothetical protein